MGGTNLISWFPKEDGITPLDSNCSTTFSLGLWAAGLHIFKPSQSQDPVA